MTRRLLAALLFLMPMVTFAATPELAGSVTLPAPAGAGAVSANGKLLVIYLQASGKRPAGMQVIDTADLAHPRLRGFLPDAGGAMALSDDGNTMLLVSQTEKPQFMRGTKHRIMAIDLSDPDHPRELWRRELEAGSVRVSASANAYAWTSLVQDKQAQHWNVSVVRLDQDNRTSTVPMKQYAPGGFSLSPHADFLVYDDYGQLIGWDLRAAQPASYQQQYSGYHRYTCLAAVLDDGHTVVLDNRVPRLGVYAWAPGLPRAAVMPLRKTPYDCNWLNPGMPSVPGHDELILPMAEGSVQQASFADPARPVVVRSWQAPENVYPVAYDGDTLFVVTGNTAPEFHTYRLDRLNKTSVDWRALERAHAAIMQKYQADLKLNLPHLPAIRATADFGQAGFGAAIDAPVTGFSPQKAAAMLNDYGFLAGKVWNEQDLADHALRRAIELDPQRALAHLNLADLLRARLGAASSDPRKGADLHKEIMAEYQAYLRLGGKPTAAISAFLAGVPGLNANSDACATIAAYANASRLDELAADWASGISYQGRKMDLLLTDQGTGHFAVAYAYDSGTDFPLDEDALPQLPDDAEQACCGDSLSLVTLRDGPHLLYAHDMHHPVSSVSLATGATCRFTSATKEIVGPKATDPKLCHDLQQERGIKRYAFDQDSPMDADAMLAALPNGMIDGVTKVDYANDGHPLMLAKVSYSPPGGVPCNGVAFHLMNADATQVMTDARSYLLGRLQGNPSGDIPAYECHSTAGSFKYGRRVYFETRPANWPPQNDSDLYRRVTTVRNGRVLDVCDFRFETRITGHQSNE